MSKILVIDDEETIRATLKLLLKSSGHEVEVAESGKEGLQKAGMLSPDLIILDVKMPEMDGWEVCTRLKTAPATARIPVLMLTALNHRDDVHEGFQSGADGYLTKPWDHKEMLAEVKRLLSSPHI